MTPTCTLTLPTSPFFSLRTGLLEHLAPRARYATYARLACEGQTYFAWHRSAFAWTVTRERPGQAAHVAQLLGMEAGEVEALAASHPGGEPVVSPVLRVSWSRLRQVLADAGPGAYLDQLAACHTGVHHTCHAHRRAYVAALVREHGRADTALRVGVARTRLEQDLELHYAQTVPGSGAG